MSWEAIAAFAALGFTIITSVVVTMRGLAKIELNLRNYFEQKHEAITIMLRDDIDRSREMFGETVKAVREHADLAHTKVDRATIEHQQLELYIRDNYVKTQVFTSYLAKIDEALERVDAKIDKLISDARP